MHCFSYRVLSLFSLVLNSIFAYAALPPNQPQGVLNRSGMPTGCTNDPRWFAKGFKKRDCFEAWNMVRLDLDRYGRGTFQFIHWGARSDRRHRIDYPPVEFRHGTCTFVVALISDAIMLPKRPRRVYGARDLSSYDDIYTAADSVLEECVLAQTMLGWTIIGKYKSLAAMFWASGSYMDRMIMSLSSMSVNGTDSAALSLWESA